jgi:Amt family ammonium transporter
LSALERFRDVLENQRLTAHFQPQVCLQSGQVTGCEVLARWATAQGDFIEPEVFLGLAEELDMLAELDRQILDLALSAFHAWKRDGLELPRISVNVSTSRLRDNALIRDLARRPDMPFGAVSFELLETTVVEDDHTLAWNIDRLREMGVSICVDNFGTGHAAMNAVLALRPERIKIDRQFVRDIPDDDRRVGMLRTLVDLVSQAGASSVIDGIETHAQHRKVAELGASEAQGFAIAAPMPRAEMDLWLRSRLARAS